MVGLSAFPSVHPDLTYTVLTLSAIPSIGRAQGDAYHVFGIPNFDFTQTQIFSDLRGEGVEDFLIP